MSGELAASRAANFSVSQSRWHPMLKITNLVKSYGSEEPVLKGLNLTVPERNVISIIGASGAGKSTLLRCINRLVEPTSGDIDLNGVTLTRLQGGQLRSARRRLGILFQSFNLADRLTVMRNVLSGRLGYVLFFRPGFARSPQQDNTR